MSKINVTTFANRFGLGRNDQWVLHKMYKKNVLKTEQEWYNLLSSKFNIKVELVVRNDEEDKKKRAAERLKAALDAKKKDKKRASSKQEKEEE